jgi:glycosyltransferase involved in cell wall biosynthesis
VAHAALVVAPLRLARGVQNKVLEAMAMGKAVLGTPEAIEGIAARTGEEVLCAGANGSFAEAAISALDRFDRDEIGRRARLRAEADYGWSSNLAGLKTILAQPGVSQT